MLGAKGAGDAALEKAIPDFKGVKSFAEIQGRFVLSAQAILREYCLALDGRRFEVTSLELYLKLHNRRDVWWDYYP